MTRETRAARYSRANRGEAGSIPALETPRFPIKEKPNGSEISP